MTDTALKQSMIRHLIEHFGNVQTERFISLMNKESYTKWQEDLYTDTDVEELSGKAMANREKKRKPLGK